MESRQKEVGVGPEAIYYEENEDNFSFSCSERY